MCDFKGFGSTPRSDIPDLGDYSHKSGIVPLGVLPDPFKLCTGSTLDMIYKSVIIIPLDTLGAIPVLLLAAKTALDATFLFVSQSKSVMLCNFRPSDLSVCLSVCVHFCFDLQSSSNQS